MIIHRIPIMTMEDVVQLRKRQAAEIRRSMESVPMFKKRLQQRLTKNRRYKNET